jgi:hypothetical protein
VAGKKNKADQTALDVYALAREAGLEIAVSQFPADVAAAAQAAAHARKGMPDLDNVVAEPWPPMRIRNMS